MFKRAPVFAPTLAPTLAPIRGPAATALPCQPSREASRKAVGDAAEALALRWLLTRGLELVQRNYRVALGPSARGAEVDLILRERDGTLVFVEVRARRDARSGGAAASVGAAKQRRIVRAAQHYLLGLAVPPPCRFDVLAIEAGQVHWHQGAFDAG